MTTITLVPNANYYEIYFVDGPSNNDIYSKSDFYAILGKVKDMSYKFFKKQYKQYIHENVIVHNYDNDEIKVQKKVLLDRTYINNTLTLAFQKTKQSMLNVSSTKNIYDIKYVKKLTFRVNNWIYINFEISSSHDMDHLDHTAYINYNHDEKVDLDLINATIKDLCGKLVATAETSR